MIELSILVICFIVIMVIAYFVILIPLLIVGSIFEAIRKLFFGR